MKKKQFAIIEIGSNNTKTHIYEDNTLIYENNTTIEFKKNYSLGQCLDPNDLERLYKIITKAKEYTNEVNVYGCSIFRNISPIELQEINNYLSKNYQVMIEVVSQKDEALYTALGCYKDIDYNKSLCVFIGGGGSIELIHIENKKVKHQQFYNFGVVDITKKFESLKDDFPTCSFDEVYNYISSLVGDIPFKADILILAGGDHLYWYNNANYELFKNTIYDSSNQLYMIPITKSDFYDHNALQTSLNKIRQNSDNPKWFDGSRAMKVITNLISHKIEAKYIIPTKINMEDGLKEKLSNQ